MTDDGQGNTYRTEFSENAAEGGDDREDAGLPDTAPGTWIRRATSPGPLSAAISRRASPTTMIARSSRRFSPAPRPASSTPTSDPHAVGVLRAGNRRGEFLAGIE